MAWLMELQGAIWPPHASLLWVCPGTDVPSNRTINHIRNWVIIVHQLDAILKKISVMDDLKGAMMESIDTIDS